MEHIDMRNSLDSKLQIYSLCSLELALEVEISSKNAGAYLQPLIFCWKILKPQNLDDSDSDDDDSDGWDDEWSWKILLFFSSIYV